MNHHILIAASVAFASQANALIKKSDHGLVLADAHLAGEGFLSGLFSIDLKVPRDGPSSLVGIQVLEGSVKSVEARLQSMIDENPYHRPLKLLTSISAISGPEAPAVENPADTTPPPAARKVAKKAATKNAGSRASGGVESTVILIVGTYQP